MNKAQAFEDVMDPDRLATDIAIKYHEWESSRGKWLELTKEARDYIFATDTRSTSSGHLGWKNSTHLPKLCQIRDNLHANYMAAIFPNDRAVTWEAGDKESNTKDKRKAVVGYMRNKLRLGDFRTEVSKSLYDFIDYGNVFGMNEFVNEQRVDEETGEIVQGFVGPRFRRISPLDIVFNPTASDFKRTPKIIRTLTTLADIASIINYYPEKGYYADVFEKVMSVRSKIRNYGVGIRDSKKNAAYMADGFGSFRDYFESDYVEILEFFGDIWDEKSEQFLPNQHIVVIDRAYIILQTQHPSWLGEPPIHHVGWRLRPDNLYAMGPLDNLIGLQYRIDHLENAKADGLDMIIHPVFKIRGYVEDFVYGPNERIYVGDDGEVEFMHPDASVLSLNTEVAQIMQIMEEMAGAPRQAMGFRTPGEKTKYEVQVLDQGANKVFLNKTAHFEVVFLEKILNSMLEIARRNFTQAEDVSIEDMDLNFVQFLTINKEDITAKGTIKAIGARRFARKANVLQDLTQFAATPLGQDPSIMTHFSGYKMAKLIEDLLEIEEYDIVGKDIRVVENAETASTAQSAQQVIQEEQAAGLANQQQLPEGAGAGVPNANPVVQ